MVLILTLFQNFTKDLSGVGILTTTFLSGIALYFSAEKPKADNLTNLDLVFTYYYFFNGLGLIIIFLEYSYQLNLIYIKYLLMMLPVIAIIHFLTRHIFNKKKIYQL